jgi:hypothetical protein
MPHYGGEAMSLYEERDILAEALRKIALGEFDSSRSYFSDAITDLDEAKKIAKEALKQCDLPIQTLAREFNFPPDGFAKCVENHGNEAP